jgi:Flp pilus assembly protein TadG
MRRVLECFSRNRRGSVAITVGLVTPVLLGFAAISVDVARARLTQATLQDAADAAALAAVQKLPDTAAATATALEIAGKNVPSDYGTVLRASDLVFGTYDPEIQVFTPTTTNATAVKLTTGRLAANGNTHSTAFGWAVGRSSLDVSTASTAYRNPGPMNCVFVLDASPNASLDASGSGRLEVPNCGIQVNSSHTRAAITGGSASVSAKSINTVGGYQGSFSPTPVTGSASQPDPLASLPEPAAPNGGVCSTWSSAPAPNQTYCGTIDVNVNTTLSAGTYYFKGATVTVSGSVNLTGNNVMLFFDANSHFNLGSSGTVKITGPLSGTYKGVSVFQSRSATENNTRISLTGSSDFLLDGTIYVPKANLRLWGSSSITTGQGSGYVISNRLTFGGSSTFTVGSWQGTQALGKRQKAALVD